jgi:hypothetical protein
MRWRRFLYITAFTAIGVATASLAQERFDYAVRDDMFRAFGGNEAAYKSAMSTIDQKSENSLTMLKLSCGGGPASTSRPARLSRPATLAELKRWPRREWPTWTAHTSWHQPTLGF